MHSFDASSIIYAWDNYPPEQFPRVWEWIANRIGENDFTIARIALDEVGDKAPECKTWLNDAAIIALPVTNLILSESMRIKGFTLVSDEQKQIKLPQKIEKYKIPAVCDLPTVEVECMSFLDLIKQSGETF